MIYAWKCGNLIKTWIKKADFVVMVWRHWWRHHHENTFSWIICIRLFHIRCQIEATFKKFWNLENFKCRNFEVLVNFFVGSVTRKWVCYIDSQVRYLHFELLIDTVAQILTESWQFQNLTYLLTSWPNYLAFDLYNKWVSSHDQVTHLGPVWWWLVKRCDLYPANNIHPDRQTDRQTNRQTNILAKIENFGK